MEKEINELALTIYMAGGLFVTGGITAYATHYAINKGSEIINKIKENYTPIKPKEMAISLTTGIYKSISK